MSTCISWTRSQGTGTFMVRLLQNPELIRHADLVRKFTAELHANEIVLLAYYIAAINIEEAYHGRRGMDSDYAPFEGIVFTDTFNLGEGGGQFPESLPVNSQRVQQQQSQDITVIVGNPPYSAGQRSASDDNPNVSYLHLEQRVRETYTAQSAVTNKVSLYDSYKLAIRWASDRIGHEGIVAFVTNGSFIDGNVDAGLRACLADEFSHLYVFHLRGNQRTQGERSRQEGGKIFGSGSRAPVAILVAVRDPAHQGTCQIHYRDIGDYLSREQKLQQVQEFSSIAGIADWQHIQPDKHHDWLDQRDPAYQTFMPLGLKEAKSHKLPKPSVAARTYSSGVKTSSDAWLYSYDLSALSRRVQGMVSFYEALRIQVHGTQGISLEDAMQQDRAARIKWHQGPRTRLKNNVKMDFHDSSLRVGMYRPFHKQHLYFSSDLIWSWYHMPKMFPTSEAPNQVIGVTGKGETAGFSTFMTNVLPDLHLIAGAQWFPRYRYEEHDLQGLDVWTQLDKLDVDVVPGYRRVDNITDWCLQQFRHQHPALHIAKDDIWYYLYGLLHALDYRERYRADLSKDLPRIPFASDFGAFRDAGAELAQLHLGYETCSEYELQVEVSRVGPGAYQLSDRKMRWGGTNKEPDRAVLHVTPAVTLRGIPEAAHHYVVNGRTPLEWAVDRLHIRHDKESGIVNDPNAWFADHPAGLVSHLRRLVQVSVETASGLWRDCPPPWKIDGQAQGLPRGPG